ncbi:MAG: lysophospholipid acyltransferase family protein [Candidatus Omnitrophica bacterium]|nr:lysophospholipid acyltransferase family protein [Candidatus Omnitrophota bacterium]
MTRRYAGYCLLRWISRWCPPALTSWMADRLADGQWRCSAVDREAVEQNVALVLGASNPAIPLVTRSIFRNFARYLVDFFALERGAAFQIEVSGAEHLRAALAKGRGAIALTAHAGNWELAGVAVRRLGFPITAVALSHDDPRVNHLFNQLRARGGVRVIPLGASGAWRESLAVLRRGEVLGLLGDRDFTGHSLQAPLLGAATMIPKGPPMLSLRSGAPLVPIFLIREAPWAFRLHVEPPIWPSANMPPREAIRLLTRAYLGVFETYLSRWPDQWLVFQRIANNGFRPSTSPR